MYILNPVYNINKPYWSRNANTNPMRTINFEARGDRFVKNVKNYTVKDLLDIFSKKPEEAPTGLKLQISPSKGTILGFTKELKNGNNLAVMKLAGDRALGGLFYIAFKEMKNGILRHSIGIDIRTEKFIGMGQKGRAVVIDGKLKVKNENEAGWENAQNLLNKYLNEIFSEKSQNLPDCVEVLTQKAQSSKKPFQKILRAEDLLDDDIDGLKVLPEDIEFEKILNSDAKAQKINLDTNVAEPEKTGQALTEPKANSITTKPQNVERGHIDIAEVGSLSQKTAEQILQINKYMLALNALFDANRGCIPRIVKFKQNYEPLVYTGSGQKRTIFKYGDNETISVVHTKTAERLTRFIHTDKEGRETHYLVENGNKVISNLDEKRQFSLPKKCRYYTPEQLKGTKIPEFAEFCSRALYDYYEAMKSALSRRRRSPNANYVMHSPEKPVAINSSNIKKIIKEIDDDIRINIGEMCKNIEQRAEKDAKKLSEEYYRILSKKFRKFATEGIETFNVQLQAFLNMF